MKPEISSVGKMFPFTLCSILHIILFDNRQVAGIKESGKATRYGYKVSAAEFLRDQIHVAKIFFLCSREQI